MLSSPVAKFEDQLSGLLGGVGGIAGTFICFVFGIMVIVASWKLFKKAGEHGWASLIPIYGDYCRARMVFGNGWYFLLALIPFVNGIFFLIESWKTATVFGAGFWGKVCMVFFTPFAIMYYAFGKAEYKGPSKLFG